MSQEESDAEFKTNLEDRVTLVALVLLIIIMGILLLFLI